MLEGADRPGGGTRTEELTLPGFAHDVCSTIHPLGVASPFFADAPLRDYGLEWIHPGAPAAHPLPDGTAVVVELSAHSPLAAFNPLWKALHGIDRPDWQVADEAYALLQALGLAVGREDIVLPPRKPDVTPQLVAFVRRRLYVGAERDDEIEAFLRDREPQEQRVAALWWPGGAG